MEAVRAAQALFVLWIGAFAALVALNNLTPIALVFLILMQKA